MRKNFIFTSSSVTDGHPDKLCDQISDAIVDRFLQQDPLASVIAECAVSQGLLFLAVRFSSVALIDVPYIARWVINEVGYRSPNFSARNCTILTSINEQPLDEERRVPDEELDDEKIERIKVRNQANVFGYACDHTPSLMPLPIVLAHKLARRLTTVRLSSLLPYLSPDGKTQVGVEFRDGRPYAISSLMILACIAEKMNEQKVKAEIYEQVIKPAFQGEEIRPDDKTFVDIRIIYDPQGCGPMLHSGLTGRKNAVDTYGEYARHSGAALSGKDPTRIDRVGAYAARYAAKNVVAAGLAKECEVHLSYAIGRSRPVSITVNTFGTGIIPDERIEELVKKHFDFRPAAIQKQFALRKLPSQFKGGFYQKLAAFGHMGRMDLAAPWERTDKKDLLKEEA
ncbi:S-adenosylmethionine synthetase [Thermodesulfatator indicus DSM 15286]|uniref:Methionine adenosyltransferase n=1 Tax=Thermodesulfatator indicus (strain DSM 15286 / JCM 11887 / CIR29812) TaxID=667014 RepID=F8AAV6_THEID|nr:methionine adenosyltransferase [Thermodesulfatator indicus]AEH45468.1 S-adenosylmethionine synthetase [Thermodesulfatator indicus DSM 15286]